jgi:cytidine deaminase
VRSYKLQTAISSSSLINFPQKYINGDLHGFHLIDNSIYFSTIHIFISIKQIKMRQKIISITWAEYDDLSELTLSDRELVEAARMASEKAYAPYSGFSVGAALRLQSGSVITGTNVENAAFPSGICAERNVLSTFASNYSGEKPMTMAIAARTSEGFTNDPVPPCGNCRQVITEEELRSGNSIRLILSGKKKIFVLEKAGDLLPIQFNRNSLIPGRHE